MEQEDIGCPGLAVAGDKDADHKIYLKEPSPGPGQPQSWFLEIRVGSGKTPGDYFTLNPAPPKHPLKVISMGTTVTDPDYPGQTWDCYQMYCPDGPPCKFLEELQQQLQGNK